MPRLADNVKRALVGVALVAAIVSQTGDGKIRICDDSGRGCQEITREVYGLLKADLADKVAADTPLDWGEYQLYLGVLNHELRGGKNIGRVQSRSEIKTKLNNLLYAQ